MLLLILIPGHLLTVLNSVGEVNNFEFLHLYVTTNLSPLSNPTRLWALCYLDQKDYVNKITILGNALGAIHDKIKVVELKFQNHLLILVKDKVLPLDIYEAIRPILASVISEEWVSMSASPFFCYSFLMRRFWESNLFILSVPLFCFFYIPL